MLKVVTLWVSIYQRSTSNPDLTGSIPTSPDAEGGNFMGKYLSFNYSVFFGFFYLNVYTVIPTFFPNMNFDLLIYIF